MVRDGEGYPTADSEQVLKIRRKYFKGILKVLQSLSMDNHMSSLPTEQIILLPTIQEVRVVIAKFKNNEFLRYPQSY